MKPQINSNVILNLHETRLKQEYSVQVKMSQSLLGYNRVYCLISHWTWVSTVVINLTGCLVFTLATFSCINLHSMQLKVIPPFPHIILIVCVCEFSTPYRSIDFSAALAMHGVAGVVTADDVLGTNFFQSVGDFIFAVNEVGLIIRRMVPIIVYTCSFLIKHILICTSKWNNYIYN